MMVKVKEKMWEKWGDCGERARMKACTGLWEKERRASNRVGGEKVSRMGGGGRLLEPRAGRTQRASRKTTPTQQVSPRRDFTTQTYSDPNTPRIFCILPLLPFYILVISSVQ
jgi:hypothetical protein